MVKGHVLSLKLLIKKKMIEIRKVELILSMVSIFFVCFKFHTSFNYSSHLIPFFMTSIS